MISSVFVKKNVNHPLVLLLIFLFPLLSSCSSNQNNVVEIITAPKFPKEFSSIPDRTDDAQLTSLLSAEDKIKDITFGRKDPFLPPQSDGEILLVPSSFKYHGQISSANTTIAFVSYENQRGTIKLGDIGGENTDLLPTGWAILNLDGDTKVLTLGYEGQSIDVELFPEW